MEVTLNKDNFEEEVLKSEVPVLVDFYADWCGPCKMMAPIVEQLAEEYQGKAKVCKINVDENSGIAEKYQVMSIPTFILFKNGEVSEKLVGGVSKADLASKLD